MRAVDEVRTVAWYVLVGIINSVTGYSTILFLYYLLDVSLAVSNIVGYAVGTVLAFFLNRRLTFRATAGKLRRQALRFLVVVAAAFLVQYGVVQLSHNRLRLPVWLAQLGGMVVFAAVGYVGNRCWAFNSGVSRRTP